MATLALITLPLSGHINPMVAGARALTQAGHRPIFVGPPDLLARLPDDVATFEIGADIFPRGELDAQCACLSRMRRWSDVKQMLALIAALSQLYLDRLPKAVDQIGAEAILHDQLEPGAGIVARGLSQVAGLRHISLACALPMNRDPSVPPPVMGWPYRPTAYGHWLNAGYYRVTNWLLRDQSRSLAVGAKWFDLSKPDVGSDGQPLQDWQLVWSVDDGLSRTHDLAQGFASLDYPRARPPAYIGPLRDAVSPFPGLEAIDGERDGRPLCFITLGTLMGGRAKLLSKMARAAQRVGLQPVIVHGGRLKDASLLADGTIVRDYLDQQALLAASEAAIVHGGYNSTMDAVAAGLPFVTVPIAFDQSAIAARIERAQIGRVVKRAGPDLVQRLAFGLSDAARDERMRAARQQMRSEVMAASGVNGLVAAVNDALSGPSWHPTDKPFRSMATPARRYDSFPEAAE